MLLSVTDPINFIYLLLTSVKEPIKIYTWQKEDNKKNRETNHLLGFFHKSKPTKFMDFNRAMINGFSNGPHPTDLPS